MPVYATGVGEDGVTPFSFVGAKLPIKFAWSISNSQVALLKSAFYTLSIKTLAGLFSLDL